MTHNPTTGDSAVSPVIAVILMVAVTVILSAVIGTFVLDLGQSTVDSSTSNLGVSVNTVNGTVTATVVTGDADSLRLLVNGSVADNISNSSAGDTLTANVSNGAKVTIVSVTDGDSRVVLTNTVASSSTETVSTTHSGLLSRYKFDTGSGSTAVDSISSYNGTITDATWDSSAKVGSHALSFNGSSDYVQLPNQTIDGATNLTISTWIRIDDNTSSSNRFFDVEAGGTQILFRHHVDNNGNSYLQFRVQDKNGNVMDASVQTSPKEKTWIHLVGVVYANNTAVLYNNRTQIASDTNSTFTSIPATDVELGRYPGGSRYFAGDLDDFRIYNQSLNQSEVQDVYEATK